MKKAAARRYDAHRDYDVDFDAALLNMVIRIYGEDYEQTGVVDYEGSVGKFIKERVPADWLVELLPELRENQKISYKFHGGKNFIERVK